MKQSSRFNCLDHLGICNADALGEVYGVPLDAPDMAMSNLIFGVNSHCQRFNRRKIQRVQLINVAIEGNEQAIDADGVTVTQLP